MSGVGSSLSHPSYSDVQKHPPVICYPLPAASAAGACNCHLMKNDFSSSVKWGSSASLTNSAMVKTKQDDEYKKSELL